LAAPAGATRRVSKQSRRALVALPRRTTVPRTAGPFCYSAPVFPADQDTHPGRSVHSFHGVLCGRPATFDTNRIGVELTCGPRFEHAPTYSHWGTVIRHFICTSPAAKPVLALPPAVPQPPLPGVLVPLVGHAMTRRPSLQPATRSTVAMLAIAFGTNPKPVAALATLARHQNQGPVTIHTMPVGLDIGPPFMAGWNPSSTRWQSVWVVPRAAPVARRGPL